MKLPANASPTPLLLTPPRAVVDIVRRLEGAGFEAWCVGGAVRDALLGEQHLDWDIATSAVPEEVRRIFRRTIPVGVEHGTLGVLDADGVMHEVTTFRRDVETDGRHAKVVFGVSLKEDLARRDFTINAMAYSPSREELFDPFDGRGDLGRGLIRTVGDAGQRMIEDRLRALRALRFAGRFGFEIEERTWKAVCASSAHLGHLSAERVRQEIEKTMDQVAVPGASFRLWKKCGAFRVLVPALANITDLEISYPDFLTKPGIAGRPVRRVNRVTALFLTVQPAALRQILRDLRFSNSDVAWICGQVERWKSAAPVLEKALADGGMPSPAFQRRWIAGIERVRTASVLRLCIAVWDARAAAGLAAPNPELVTQLYGRMLRRAYRDPVELGDLAVDGDDLRSIGVRAGPGLGRVLAALLERVIEDPSLNTRAALLQIAGETAGTDESG